MATGMLEEFGYAIEEKSISSARHFQVPRKTTSLLMLESEADYARFNIAIENDEKTVNSSTVNGILETLLKNLEKSLGNSKSKFGAWLEKLKKIPGLSFATSKDLVALIGNTPEAQFLVQQESLSMR